MAPETQGHKAPRRTAMKQSTYQDKLRQQSRQGMQKREGWKLAILVVMTLILITLFFGGGIDQILLGMFHDTPTETPKSVGEYDEIKIPKINMDLVAQIKDENKQQRYTDEAGPFAHLLEVANMLYPATLQALGMQKEMVPVSKIRTDPNRYRAKPLWFAGELVSLDPPKPIPTLPGTKLTRGRLRTDNGETILFGVLDPVPPNLIPGSFVRVEGLFFKLRDDPFLKLEKAPYILGPKLREAFRKFEPVTKIDPQILSTVKDKTNAEARLVEPLPLYHLSSYVLNKGYSRKGWRSDYPEITTKDETLMKENPELMRGKGFMIVGALAHIQVKAAEGNPLGVEQWSRVWLYRTGMGFFQVRIPGYIDITKYKVDDVVVVYAHFLKKIHYETSPDREGGQRFRKIPLFVAKRLLRFNLITPLSTKIFRWSMGLVSLLLILLFVWLVRSDNKRNREVTQRVLEIRKRRREKARNS